MLNSERAAILDFLQNETANEDNDLNFRVNELPRIMITDRPNRAISQDSIDALKQGNEPPSLFVRSGQMVHIVTDEHMRCLIKPVEPAYLRGRMDRNANYQRLTREGAKQSSPPKDVVTDILALEPSCWPFPVLEGLVEIPVLRADGTVVDKPGYDAASGIFFKPLPNLEIPKISSDPTIENVTNAVSTLFDVIGEFPYSDSASRANVLALMLTPIVRATFDGPVPLALIDAPQAGTGKSLLTRVIAIITTGTEAAMMSAPRDEEEFRKSITATLIGGASFVIYDNLTHELRSSSLAVALTTSTWKDRILGLTQTVTVPQRATWIVTGNNLKLATDLARRAYQIRLDAQVSQPWTRTNFRHPELLTWVREHRGELVSSLLTLARAWFAAGKPEASVPRIGGFEGWANSIGGILAYAGVPGFLTNLQELYENVDDTSSQWESFLRVLGVEYGEQDFTVAALEEDMRINGSLKESLPEGLAIEWGDKETASMGFKVRLGKAFRNRIGRRYGSEGLHIKRSGTESKGGCFRWKVAARVER